AGNIIADNQDEGILLGILAQANVVQGNVVRDHPGSGINLEFGATANTVGGSTAAAGNRITGNNFGVYLSGLGTAANLVQFNTIGDAGAGNFNGVGIQHGAQNNTIRDNIIAGNAANGVLIATNSMPSATWSGPDGNDHTYLLLLSGTWTAAEAAAA